MVPEPRKRPRASYKRFEADAPNECWQIDATHWSLTGGRVLEIFNIVDDHSRLAIASRAVSCASTEEAWVTFAQGIDRFGLPTRCLSDNGLAFSGRLRGVQVGFEARLVERGIAAVTARPFHPQTCGKVERYQQTLKRFLRAKPAAADLEELQAQLDEFRAYYNHQRPHRAIGRITPFNRWAGGPQTGADGVVLRTPERRTRVVSPYGVVRADRWLIALGIDYAGQDAEVLIDGDHAAVFVGGELIRDFQLDRTRCYQPSGKRRGPKRKDGT